MPSEYICATPATMAEYARKPTSELRAALLWDLRATGRYKEAKVFEAEGFVSLERQLPSMAAIRHDAIYGFRG